MWDWTATPGDYTNVAMRYSFAVFTQGHQVSGSGYNPRNILRQVVDRAVLTIP
jgi:hypothetical protein